MMPFVVEGSTAQERFKQAQRVLRNVRLRTSAACLAETETLITHPKLLAANRRGLEPAARFLIP